MAAIMKSILQKSSDFIQNIGKKKLILLAGLVAVVLAAGIIGAVVLNQVHYTVLYSELDASEAGTIKTLLDEKGIKSKVQGTSSILVPEEQADELRIQLASEGYPSTGLNYDIFSGSSALGSTDLERRTYLQYQLQENMRATIRGMEKVQDCVVIVNLASDSSYVVSDNQTDASVAVMLKLKDEEKLSGTEAKTIGEFVMKCVPNLKQENVSIVDSKMNYYDITGKEEETEETYSASQQQLTEEMKQTLTDQVVRVLEPAMGSGNVAVSVNLSLDFDKQTVSKVEFTPPVSGETEGLIRSSEEISNAVNGSTESGGQAGTDTNGSGTPAYVAETSASPDGELSTSNTYNYELNQIQTQIEKAQGSVQDLSVAVLVNANVEGIDAYAGQVKSLVAQSIGVKPDYISVEMLPFVDNAGVGDAFSQQQKVIDNMSQRKMIVNIIEVVAILAAVVVIARLFIKKPQRQAMEPLAVGAGNLVSLTTGDYEDEEALEASPTYDLTDLVLKKSTEAEKIEELMDRYPETVAQILRVWLSEDN